MSETDRLSDTPFDTQGSNMYKLDFNFHRGLRRDARSLYQRVHFYRIFFLETVLLGWDELPLKYYETFYKDGMRSRRSTLRCLLGYLTHYLELRTK